MKKIGFLLCMLMLFIIPVKALEEKTVTNNCSDVTNCVIETDYASITIKEIFLTKEDGTKLTAIDSWNINPQYFYESEEGSSGHQIKLNMTFSNLKDLAINYKENNEFSGFVNVSYNINFKNPKNFIYNISHLTVDDAFALIFNPTSINNFVVTNPIDDEINYYYVNLDSTNNLTVQSDYTLIDDDGLTSSGDCGAVIFLSDETLDLTNESMVLDTFALSDVEEENIENDPTDIIENKNNYDDNNKDEVTNIDSSDKEEQQKDEKSNEKNPDTSVFSNIMIITILLISITGYIIVNKRILKRSL